MAPQDPRPTRITAKARRRRWSETRDDDAHPAWIGSRS
jgi:hypothetical protein